MFYLPGISRLKIRYFQSLLRESPRSLHLCVYLALVSTGIAAESTDWPSYLGNNERSHYSPLKQINAKNVGQLKVAWTYHAGGARPDGRSQIQCSPIIVDGVMYGTSP